MSLTFADGVVKDLDEGYYPLRHTKRPQSPIGFKLSDVIRYHEKLCSPECGAPWVTLAADIAQKLISQKIGFNSVLFNGNQRNSSK